jgi:hypothetical protein
MGLFGESWHKTTVAGIAASFSNTVLVGISIILSTFGEPAAAPLFLLVSIHLPVMTTVGTVLMEAAGGRRSSIGAAFPQVTVGPAQRSLQHEVQATEAQIERHLHAPDDDRLHVVQGDLRAGDGRRQSHAAGLTTFPRQFPHGYALAAVALCLPVQGLVLAIPLEQHGDEQA